MANIFLPNGSTISISSGFGSAKTVSAITNANPGVASSTAHGITDGTYVVVSSGWAKLDGRVVRTDNAITDAFDLEGVDTTSTTDYPVGAGAGTVKAVTGWTQITGILGSSSSGGEQNYWTGAPLESDRELRIPTTKSAAGIDLEVSDDPSASFYNIVKAANDDRAPRAVLLTLANGSKILYNAYVSMGIIPSLNRDNPMTVKVTLSLVSDPVRYAS